MRSLDTYDVDSFGILDSPEPPIEAAPAAPHIEFSQKTHTNEIVGHNNVAAQGNIDQSTRSFDIHSAVFVENQTADWLAQAKVQKRNGRGLQDDEALKRLAKNYVLPPGLLEESSADKNETALQILLSRRVLFIVAKERACGQLSAGLRLGYALQKKQSGLVVREELIDQDFRLHADVLLVKHEPAAVIVDLHASSDLQIVYRGLVEFSKNLEHYQSYLMLIIPFDQERKFDQIMPDRVYHLGKPSSVEVLARYLTKADARLLITATDVADRLEQLWPPKVKELAEAVDERIGDGESPDDALRRALDNELQNSTPALRDEIERRQQAENTEWLALLLSAAILEGASPDHIVTASDLMLACNKLPANKTVPLLRPSPYTRLQHLDYAYFKPATRRFQPRGYGSQVVRHFWREHPELHDTMLKWIGGLPADIRDLTSEELDRIADRSAELATEGGSEIALTLARMWSTTKAGSDSDDTGTSNRSTDRYRRSVAVRLLTTTAADSSLGSNIRQKLWDWSTGSNADLQLLTAEVCVGIGKSFPRVALTRLKHLASSQNERVRASVLAAVQQIGIELGISRFLRYLSEWFEDAPPTRLGILSEGVARALKEHSGEVDTDAAATFWRRALDTMPPASLRPVVESWLRAAATASIDQRDGIVESLVMATKADSIRIAQVQHASRFGRASLDLSSLGTDPVIEVVHQLWTRLDEVDPIWQ